MSIFGNLRHYRTQRFANCGRFRFQLSTLVWLYLRGPTAQVISTERGDERLLIQGAVPWCPALRQAQVISTERGPQNQTPRQLTNKTNVLTFSIAVQQRASRWRNLGDRPRWTVIS
jgi:hypothetical protein